MKEFIIILLLITVPFINLFAQNYENKWGLDIDYGSIEYRGELGDQIADFSQWESGYGVQFSRYLSPYFNTGLRVGYNFLSVMGPGNQTFSMNADMYTVLATGEFKLANGVTIQEDARIKPYLKVGGGMMFGESYGSSMDNNGDPYTVNLNDWIYSFKGGAKVNVYKNIDAFVEVGNLWITAVGMDGSKSDATRDQFMQFNLGLSFSLGLFKDADRDGVSDRTDQCRKTPENVIVDKVGCPIDTDGDGVADYLDRCLDEFGTAKTHGCPDMDEDGVADHVDLCPDEFGTKSNQGCPVNLKAKNDSLQNIMDRMEKNGVNIYFVYPEDGIGVPQVYSIGKEYKSMPYDNDGDGIANNIDRCPNLFGDVANYGCPTGDALNARIDSNNVSLGTPVTIQAGCPLDKDCDGITDSLDQCPESPGAIRYNGCPIEVLEPHWRNDLKMDPVHFMTADYSLTDFSRDRVDALIKVLYQNPELYVWLMGFTDPRGSEEFNAMLSAKRLKTIQDYMVSQGISDERIYTIPLGESLPVITLDSADPLMHSRRVEFFMFEFK